MKLVNNFLYANIFANYFSLSIKLNARKKVGRRYIWLKPELGKLLAGSKTRLRCPDLYLDPSTSHASFAAAQLPLDRREDRRARTS